MVQGETHGDARDESGDRSATGRAASRPSSRLIVPFILLAIPPLIFYSVLLRTLVNIPNLDDYDAVIRFLNLVTDLHTAADKFSLLFSYQQGEFKLILLRALAWMQYEVTGHVNFKVLSLLGDGTVVLLAILLWKMFLPGHKDLARRMTLFAPAAWLLFQLQYWEALNFATPGLQHLAVLPFAFGAIYFLTRPERWTYYAALAVLVLAVASDGNGLMVMPVGLLILLVSRRAGRIPGWLAVSAGCIALYAYHYTTLPAPAGTSSSLVSIIFELKIPFVLGLIGSAASLSLFVVP
ncbi:MAG TPA: hypothetical protein VFI20_13680, partial [Terracidiphilus sp.]|nr:hypothetical protein [Terracidiphilus sp.]